MSRAFFIPDNGGDADFSASVTSFLCTDRAREIFAAGGSKLDNLPLSQPQWAFPELPKNPKIKTNQECLDHARAFYRYADVEGYRGTPHKL